MAAGYGARQSTIINGNVIQASDFNDEYNAILSAFNASTGHDHSGGAGLGAPIVLTSAVSGILPTANGGTGIAYFTAAGPTVARVYTFPDAATTILTTNAAVTAAQGGTGQAGGYAIGDILYASGATALSKLADIATGNALISGGITTAPSWGKIGLTTHISGTLVVANGGTGLTTLTDKNVIIGAGTSNVTFVAPGSSGNVLKSDGTNWTSGTLTNTFAGLTDIAATVTTMIPNTDNAIDLGSSTKSYRAVYATTVELGSAATDTTLTRASAGDVSVEGNRIFRVGGTDVPIADGGTGASTASAARTNLGSTTVGDAVFIATNGNAAVVAAQASRTSVLLGSDNNSAVSGNGTIYQITYGTETRDILSDAVSNAVTARVTALHAIVVSQMIDGYSVTHTTAYLTVYKNGSEFARLDQIDPGVSSGLLIMKGTVYLPLTAGDIITTRFCASGGTKTVNVDGLLSNGGFMNVEVA